MNPKVSEGIHLFNSRKFFEAHEALEEVWLKAKGKEKIFLHGLIQVAAAFHHLARNNPEGFQSLLKKGMTKLESCGEELHEVDLSGLRMEIGPWRDYLSAAKRRHQTPRPSLPRIRLKV